jgi:hypothetical protein
MKFRSLAFLLTLTLSFNPSLAARGLFQSPAPPSEKIKQTIQKIGVAGEITVVLKGGDEYYGAVTQIEADSFELAEVDRQQKIRVRYDEVKKVSQGYGRKKNLYGKRIPPRTSRIVAVAILGGLFGLVLFAAKGTK